MAVDGFRYLDGATRRVMVAWRDRETAPTDIPWTGIGKPLAEARVALISTSGLSQRDDEPFDQEGERADPWWGDPTHRVLPRETRAEDVHIAHLHIDPRPAAEDLDCLFPLRRLDELVSAGVVGSTAPRHYSIMGYLLRPEEMVENAVPEIAESLREDQVDLALLVPV